MVSSSPLMAQTEFFLSDVPCFCSWNPQNNIFYNYNMVLNTQLSSMRWCNWRNYNNTQTLLLTSVKHSLLTHIQGIFLAGLVWLMCREKHSWYCLSCSPYTTFISLCLTLQSDLSYLLLHCHYFIYPTVVLVLLKFNW